MKRKSTFVAVMVVMDWFTFAVKNTFRAAVLAGAMAAKAAMCISSSSRR